MQEFQSDSVGVSSTSFNLSDLDFEVGGQRSSFFENSVNAITGEKADKGF